MPYDKGPLCLLLFVLGLVPTASPAPAQMDDVEIVAHHVRGPIYMLEGNGGNIGVSVGEDGILIIDDQFAPLAEKIRAALRELSDGKLVFLLNTHHHFDHTGGNAHFGEQAIIVAHRNVRSRLQEQNDTAAAALPVITFDDSLSIHFNGEEIRMRHFPHGHTDNDSVIFFTGSNVVHMGDLLFTTSFPSFYPNQGGDIEGYVRNVGEVLQLLHPDAKIIAGHGRLATVDDVRAFHSMLVETTDIVRQRLAASASAEDARDAGLPDRYHAWTSPFTSVQSWVWQVYRSLAD